jgi:hypothetical protein
MACQIIASRRTGSFGKERARRINLRGRMIWKAGRHLMQGGHRISLATNAERVLRGDHSRIITYSGDAPTGEPPGGRCRNVIDA